MAVLQLFTLRPLGSGFDPIPQSLEFPIRQRFSPFGHLGLRTTYIIQQNALLGKDDVDRWTAFSPLENCTQSFQPQTPFGLGSRMATDTSALEHLGNHSKGILLRVPSACDLHNQQRPEHRKTALVGVAHKFKSPHQCSEDAAKLRRN